MKMDDKQSQKILVMVDAYLQALRAAGEPDLSYGVGIQPASRLRCMLEFAGIGIPSANSVAEFTA
jgi:hypothetical protein